MGPDCHLPRAGRLAEARATAPRRPAWRAAGRPLVAAALPVLLAMWVYYPITANYFYADDFIWLLAIVNDGFLRVVLRPFAGHELLVRNLVFYASYQLFGLRAGLFFWTVLLVHATNVWLLFRVLRTLTSSLALASFGAALWGTSPLAGGTLEWYSAFGHALVATCLLVVLDGLTRQARSGRPLRARAAWLWYGLLLAGSTCFGVGMAVALAFPAVLFLLSPALWSQRRVRAAYLALPLVTVALYLVLRRLAWLLEPPSLGEIDMEAVSWSRLAMALPAVPRLLGFGAAAVTEGFFFSAGTYPDGVALVTLAALGTGLALVSWRGDRATRRTAAAMAILCLGVYFAIGWGRSTVTGAPGGMRRLVTTPRYQYVASIAIVVTICLMLQTLGRLPGLRAIPRAALLVAALLIGAYGFHTSSFRVTDFSWCRDEFEAARAAIAAGIRLRPASGDITLLDNGTQMPKFLGPLPVRPWFPGRAALFVLALRDQPFDGRRVRFLERNQDILAWYGRWPGTPLAELLVGPEAPGAPGR